MSPFKAGVTSCAPIPMIGLFARAAASAAHHVRYHSRVCNAFVNIKGYFFVTSPERNALHTTSNTRSPDRALVLFQSPLILRKVATAPNLRLLS